MVSCTDFGCHSCGDKFQRPMILGGTGGCIVVDHCLPTKGTKAGCILPRSFTLENEGLMG